VVCMLHNGVTLSLIYLQESLYLMNFDTTLDHYLRHTDILIFPYLMQFTLAVFILTRLNLNKKIKKKKMVLTEKKYYLNIKVQAILCAVFIMILVILTLNNSTLL